MKDHEKPGVLFAQAVGRMRDDMPAQLEYVALEAKITRARFEALVAAGFTDQQAIEICCKRGV